MVMSCLSFQTSLVISCRPFWACSSGKEPACQFRRPGFDPWIGKMPWRRVWQSTPVFLPGEFHGQRNLAGYSPQGRKEAATTEMTWHTHRPSSFCLPPLQSQHYTLGFCKGRVHFQIPIPMLAFYCHVTKHPKTYWLKATILLSLIFL